MVAVAIVRNLHDSAFKPKSFNGSPSVFHSSLKINTETHVDPKS